MQNEIIEKTDAFADNGEVTLAGWSKKPNILFNSEMSKQEKSICKNSIYYINNGEISLFIMLENQNKDFYIKIVLANLLQSVCVGDFTYKKQFFNKIDILEPFTKGNFFYKDKKVEFEINNTETGQNLKCIFLNFNNKQDLSFNIDICAVESESMNQIAPFEKDRKYFYYKKFAPIFLAKGKITVGKENYSLLENTITYYECAKFFKPKKHNYEKISSDCFLNGTRFTLSLASRVGDNRYGTENCFFVNNKLEKLFKLEVKNTENRIDRPWYLRGGVSAFDVTFKPSISKNGVMSATMGKTTVVYGKLYGEINRVNYNKPIVLNGEFAHIILNEM